MKSRRVTVMLPERLMKAVTPILETRRTTVQSLIRNHLEDLVEERAKRQEALKARGAA